MKFLGPMRWIGTIIPPAWNHDDFTILAAMSKRRTRSAWPHVSPQLELQGFLMFYRASMEETQFKSVMSSPDQAEWICPNCPFPDCWTIPIYQVISIHWSSPIITGTIDRRLRSALRKMRIAKNFQVLIAKGGCLSVKKYRNWSEQYFVMITSCSGQNDKEIKNWLQIKQLSSEFHQIREFFDVWKLQNEKWHLKDCRVGVFSTHVFKWWKFQLAVLVFLTFTG